MAVEEIYWLSSMQTCGDTPYISCPQRVRHSSSYVQRRQLVSNIQKESRGKVQPGFEVHRQFSRGAVHEMKCQNLCTRRRILAGCYSLNGTIIRSFKMFDFIETLFWVQTGVWRDRSRVLSSRYEGFKSRDLKLQDNLLKGVVDLLDIEIS